MHDRSPIRDLTGAFVAGRLSRRQLLQRAAALGIGTAALGSVLSPASFLASRAAAQADGELIVAAGGDIDTTDPHVSQLLPYNTMMRLTCFNSLVRYSPDLDYLPDLAESWENPDELTYVFTLREGVTYHNGEPLEASHVEFSFNRIAEKETIFSSRVANIESYEVIDPRTIQITLQSVQADFIDGLVLLSIISPEIAEQIETDPIGTGPFAFVEWVTNDHISLERNSDYFEPDVPSVERLTFQIIPEAQVAITNLQAGAVGGVLDVPVSQATALAEDEDVQVIIEPTSGLHLFEMMGLNSEPIRTNARVRQALAHCLNKDAVQQTVFNGEGRQKWTFAPIGSWADTEVSGYDYDPARASEILAEEGVEGLAFSVFVPQGFADGERAATIWQAGLAEAGIELAIEVQEISVWLDNYINHTYDVIWNVFPGFADPNYFVAVALQPHLADQWQNEDAARLAAEANATIDQAARADLYAELQQLFVEELPIIVIQEAPQASITQPNVSGWEINPVGFVVLRDVTVA